MTILLMVTSVVFSQNTFINFNGVTSQKTFTDKVGLGISSPTAHLSIKSTSGEPVFSFTGYTNQSIYGYMESATGLRILNWYGTKLLPMISTYDLGESTHPFRYWYFTHILLGTVNLTSSCGKVSADSATLNRVIILDTTQGLILKNHAGTKYRLRISPTGVLSAVAVP